MPRDEEDSQLVVLLCTQADDREGERAESEVEREEGQGGKGPIEECLSLLDHVMTSPLQTIHAMPVEHTGRHICVVTFQRILLLESPL
jgi:hypothetical protein